MISIDQFVQVVFSIEIHFNELQKHLAHISFLRTYYKGGWTIYSFCFLAFFSISTIIKFYVEIDSTILKR